MAKKIVWTKKALAERQKILLFWTEHNQSVTYSIKLDNLIQESINFISKNPYSGKETDIENIRIKIIRDYLLFYKITGNIIFILTLWDSRRNPKKLKLK